jgi:Na+/citrate or Na+/malate symporter
MSTKKTLDTAIENAVTVTAPVVSSMNLMAVLAELESKKIAKATESIAINGTVIKRNHGRPMSAESELTLAMNVNDKRTIPLYSVEATRFRMLPSAVKLALTPEELIACSALIAEIAEGEKIVQRLRSANTKIMHRTGYIVSVFLGTAVTESGVVDCAIVVRTA